MVGAGENSLMLLENLNRKFIGRTFFHIKGMNQRSGSLHLVPCFCCLSLLLMKDTEEHCQLIYGFVHDFWYRFFPFWHQLPYYELGPWHRQILIQLVHKLLGWEVGPISPPTAAIRPSLLILQQHLHDKQVLPVSWYVLMNFLFLLRVLRVEGITLEMNPASPHSSCHKNSATCRTGRNSVCLFV